MSRDLLSISIRMLKPRNDIEHSLSYENEPVIYTMPTIWSAMTLEVYETQYKQSDVGLIGYEWRLIEVEKHQQERLKRSLNLIVMRAVTQMQRLH